ncbi:hypothetical protein ACFXA3_18555 [Streptomyces sp. NPDC059456]|uniref:hypothetical protein n=1 Tax=Streptomyces sp. NPDC059456 TaxID=3346838 RepID=UPI0036BAA1AB
MPPICRASKAVERRAVRGRRGGGAATGGSPAPEGFEGRSAGGRFPDEQLAIEDRPAAELLGGRHRVGESVLDQRPAPGLHQHPP